MEAVQPRLGMSAGELSARGDQLEEPAATVDVWTFRATLDAALGRQDRCMGGQPALDPVLNVRTLALQAMGGPPLTQPGRLVADPLSRLSWRRGDAAPDAHTRQDFGEALIAAGAPEAAEREGGGQ